MLTYILFIKSAKKRKPFTKNPLPMSRPHNFHENSMKTEGGRGFLKNSPIKTHVKDTDIQAAKHQRRAIQVGYVFLYYI